MVFQKGHDMPEEIRKKISNTLKGRTITEEHKEKISKTLKGHEVSIELRKKISENVKLSMSRPEIKDKISGKNSPHFGKHLSIEAKEKLSINHKGLIKGSKHPFFGKKLPESTLKKMRARSLGEKNPAWKGGIASLPYCHKFNVPFKERVRAFFDYCCVECGQPEINEKHHIHHCHYNKKMCCDGSPRDVVALCHSCHTKTNTHRDYWEKHFTDIIQNYYQGKCFFTNDEMESLRTVI